MLHANDTSTVKRPSVLIFVLFICLLLGILSGCQNAANTPTGSGTAPSAPTTVSPSGTTDPSRPQPTQPSSVPATTAAATKEIPDWLIGTWETISRTDQPTEQGMPAVSYLNLSSYHFEPDGTGYCSGCEWSNRNGEQVSEEWVVSPMGYPRSYFTFYAIGNTVYITITGDDMDDYAIPQTEVMTLQASEGGAASLHYNDSVRYFQTDNPAGWCFEDQHSAMLEALCRLCGVDHTLPSQGRPVSFNEILGTWCKFDRLDLDRGIYILREKAYKFNESGSGCLFEGAELSNMNAYGEISGSWTRTSESDTHYFHFTFQDNMLVLTYEGADEGLVETFYVSRPDSDLLTLTDPTTGDPVNYAKHYDNRSIKTMCELLDVDYSLPATVSNLQTGSWYSLWRTNDSSGSASLRLVQFRFNQDGTGEFTMQAYTPWDQEQNRPCDSWEPVPAEYRHAAFTYNRSGYKLTITGDYEEIFTAYRIDDSFIGFHLPESEPQAVFNKLYNSVAEPTLQELCTAFGVDYTLPQVQVQTKPVTADALLDTWQQVYRQDLQGGYYSLTTTAYIFRPDGTGEYVSRYWINQDAQQNITEQWYERLDERQVFPYTYRLEGNALTITYSDLPNSFSVNLRLYEDGSLSMVDVFGYAAKYVSVQIAPTLEALCDAMQVDYTLPPPPM